MRHHVIPLLLVVVTVSSMFSAQQRPLALVTSGKSGYSIVIGRHAPAGDFLAARVLQRYIRSVSGAELPIISDTQPASEEELVVGMNARTRRMKFPSMTAEGGFEIRTQGRRIFFEGRGENGAANGVYAFIEKYLGCRMYSAAVTRIPHSESITCPPFTMAENPVFTHRSINSSELESEEYRRWHKDLRQNEKDPMWGMFVHTMSMLVPPVTYFEAHPEYYALRNGLRVKEQLCLSNPDVFRIVVEQLRARMKEKPEATMWSVSQNDNFSYCQCPVCSALDAREGSPSGSVLNFVNKVARLFPHKIISTLAYEYSRKPPRTLKPEKNVNIMLCTIECMRTHPLSADTSQSGFVRDMRDWCRLTDNIFLWDYVVQFNALVSPFPNLHVLQPNIQFFAANKAKMQFQQGQGDRPGGEFSELRTYLIAKLLWNPWINIDSVTNDFLTGFYGKASTPIRAYIDLMRDSLIASKAGLWIYDNPVVEMTTFLTPGLMKRYGQLFDEAENAVSSEPEVLARVKAARLPLVYAALEQAKVIGEGPDGVVLKSGDGYIPNPRIIGMLEQFRNGCRLAGDVSVNEKGLMADAYVERYRAMLAKTMKNPLALFAPVTFAVPPSVKYPANGVRSLTDGRRGDEDHHFNWIGFEGESMEAVVDLQSPKSVKKISTAFLQIQESWIFLPSDVEISVSADGKSYTTVATLTHSEPLERKDAFIHTFDTEIEPVAARFIKVKAVNITTCPRWHPGYPDKAWIFTDEIVVE